MSEPTLELAYAALAAEVGDYLGFGRGNTSPETDPAWTTNQSNRIKLCIDSGIRQFVNPPVLPGEPKAYDWSFLKPTATFNLSSGAQTVALPDDFSACEGAVTVTTSSGAVQFWTLRLQAEGAVREAYSVTPTATGRPLIVAEQPLRAPGVMGQRFQLWIYPIADQAYILSVPYYVNPDAITSASPHAWGGSAHSETILASCLAAAELWQDGARGPRYAYWMERLQASVSSDRRAKPQLGGYNGDRSDNYYDGRRPNLHGWGPAIKYNGVTY